MKQYRGMRKATDWGGKRVITTRKIKNGLGSIPAGTHGVLDKNILNGKIGFTADACSCCGFEFGVRGLHYDDFVLEDITQYTMPKHAPIAP